MQQITCFLFRRSIAAFFMSFFESPDPGGIPYCIGERAGVAAGEAAMAGAVVGTGA